MIAIINYGIGNLLSVQNMLIKAGVRDVVITDDSSMIAQADKIILPGVGHFDYGMRKLKASACFDILTRKALDEKVPILGICLGAQLLTNGSEEGTEKGLGWIDAETIGFQADKFEESLPVPHMGWSEVSFSDHPLFYGMYDTPRFYFVHSFILQPKHESDVMCTSTYGYSFASGIARHNIYGVQFHPEKSHKFGLKLLDNFSKI